MKNWENLDGAWHWVVDDNVGMNEPKLHWSCCKVLPNVARVWIASDESQGSSEVSHHVVGHPNASFGNEIVSPQYRALRVRLGRSVSLLRRRLERSQLTIDAIEYLVAIDELAGSRSIRAVLSGFHLILN